MQQLRIGGIGDVLLLHRRIHVDTFEILFGQVAIVQRQAILLDQYPEYIEYEKLAQAPLEARRDRSHSQAPFSGTTSLCATGANSVMRLLSSAEKKLKSQSSSSYWPADSRRSMILLQTASATISASRTQK